MNRLSAVVDEYLGLDFDTTPPSDNLPPLAYLVGCEIQASRFLT